jgi:hypothetical protein
MVGHQARFLCGSTVWLIALWTGCANESGVPTAGASDSGTPIRGTDAARTSGEDGGSIWDQNTGARDGGAPIELGPPAPGYSRIFHDGFEDGTTNKWDNYGATVTEISPRSGAYAARSNWNGLLDWTDPDHLQGLALGSWPYEVEFLLRFWLRVDPNVDSHPEGGGGGKLFRMPFGNDREGNEIVWSRSDTHVYIAVDGTTERSIWGCADLDDRLWHKVEIYIRDAADGEIRFWVDDRLLDCENTSGLGVPYVGDTHRNDAGWDNFYWPSNWSGPEGCCDHDAENYMYLDDVEIFSDAVGGDGPIYGSLLDGTAEVSGL